MDELMKTFEGKSENNNADEEPAEVNGLLAVHISTIHTVQEEIQPSMVDLLQLCVSYGNTTKCCPISFTGDRTNRIDCGVTRHLPIQLPKDCDCPENWLTIELLIKSPLLLGSDKTLSKAMLHIHNIIYESPLYGECKLRESTGDVFALASVEFVFTYGMFGFGESFQLHHPVKKAGHFLHHSMFPRLLPPDSRVDTNCMLIPVVTRHPSFIPFKKQVSLSNHEVPGGTQSFKPELLPRKMTRLNSLRAEYEQKKDRHQKLAFLQGLALKKSPSSSHLDIRIIARDQRSM